MRDYKEGKMRDVKFKVAVIIIFILVIALLYVTLIGPLMQRYLIDKQLEGQQSAVNSIIQIVNQQGYIILSNDQTTIVLARNPQLEAQLQDQIQQQAQE
jgi:hypothetical protein